MRKLQRLNLISRLALGATLAALAVGAQAQTSTAQCGELRGKLDSSLESLRSNQMDLARLKVIIRGYEAQRGMSILPTTGLVVRLDKVEDKALATELKIEQLTYNAGVYRAEIKKCEGNA
jgi:hypothetical protein